MFIRYEFEKDDERIGILTGLDKYFSDDEILALGWVFEKYLDLPDINMEKTKSYFTEKGNRKFGKAIRRIKQAAKKHGLNVVCEKLNLIDTILYADAYQVVVQV